MPCGDRIADQIRDPVKNVRMRPNGTSDEAMRGEKRENDRYEVECCGWSNKWAAAGIRSLSIYDLVEENAIESIKYRGTRLMLTCPRVWFDSLKET